jgi:C4-dicarboxylate transporter DctM subunit
MTSATARKLHPVFLIVVVAIVALPFLGSGGLLTAAILAMALLGEPLFVLIGVATVLCLILYAGFDDISQFSVLIERIRSLADSPPLLAIPLFIMSGAIMSEGAISRRLVDFAKALIGWLPGGLAISAVIACMLFAAISGSSPATVVAIGAMMGPTLIDNRYSEHFSHGLVTSAGSLGILIPPSIPMIIYPIVNQGAQMEVEQLFASGFGPGLVMGAILAGFSIFHGIKDQTPRQPFDAGELWRATLDGFWALLFPILILGGIYGGIYNAIEASAISVIYAVVVEVYIHRALTLPDVPRIFKDTGIFLGSLLVIMVAALALAEFLEGQGIPAAAAEWLESMHLEPWQFLVVLNLMLLVVGAMMDILSAMFIFVPLLAPMAMTMGVDPMHFGIIFIVNLEIGYLTPPVGLNLFVASALFERPVGHVFRSVAPFIALMFVGLMLITYVPEISVGLGRAILGVEAPAEVTMPAAAGGELGAEEPDEEEEDEGEASLEELAAELERIRGLDMPNMEDMQREAEITAEIDARVEALRGELEQIQSLDMPNMEDMQREAEITSLIEEYGGGDEDAGL